MPSAVFVVDDSGAKAPGWINAGSRDGNGGQVDHEDRESNRKRS